MQPHASLTQYIPHLIGLIIAVAFVYLKDKYEERRAIRRRKEYEERWAQEKKEMEILDPIEKGVYYCYQCGIGMPQPLRYITCRVNGHGGTYLACKACFDGASKSES